MWQNLDYSFDTNAQNFKNYPKKKKKLILKILEILNPTWVIYNLPCILVLSVIWLFVKFSFQPHHKLKKEEKI